MDHFRLSDELRQKLIESASWSKVGVPLTKDSEVIEEAKKMKDDKPSRKKPEQHKDTEADCDKEADKLSEEVHVCPLCTSQLDESIDEERLLEHLDVVIALVERLSRLQEGEEDVEAVIDQTISEILLQNDEVNTLDEDEEVVEEE